MNMKRTCRWCFVLGCLTLAWGPFTLLAAPLEIQSQPVMGGATAGELWSYSLLAQAAARAVAPSPPPDLDTRPAAESMIWVDATNGLWNGTRGRQDRPFSNLGRALAACKNGDVILIRPRVYWRQKLDYQLTKSVSIVGSGMYNTILVATNLNLAKGQTYAVLTSHLPTMTNSGTYLEVGNLTVDCNGANNRYASNTKISGIYLVAESVTVEKVRVVGSVQETDEAFAIGANAKRSIIRDCRVENSGKAYLTAIMGSGSRWDRVQSIVIEGNWVDGMGAWPSVGIGLAYAQNVHINNNTVTNAAHGIMCDTGGLNNAIITGNILHGVSAPGMTSGFYLAYYGSKDISFEGNLVSGFDIGVMITPQSGKNRNANQRHLRTRIQDNTFLGCRTNIWAMNLASSRITGNRANGGENEFALCQSLVFADNTMESGGAMKGITNSFYSTPQGAAFDSQPLGFNRFPSRAPGNPGRPWFWLPVQVDGTNAVIPVYR